MSTLHVENLKGPTSGANANTIIVPSGQSFSAPGHVVQVGHTYNHQVSAHQTFSSSSLVGSGVTCTLTPLSTNNKFIITWTVSMHYGGNNSSYAAGCMKYKIGSGSYNFVDGADGANTPYNLGYGHSGNVYGPMVSTSEVDITSTSAYTFEPFYRNSNGLSTVWCHTRASYSLLVMEIAG